MRFIKTFSELSKQDVSIAGGKGASLGEMTRAGIPVPSGFVVLTNAFDHFLRISELEADIESILHGVNHEQVSSVERASEQIRGLLREAPMPEVLALQIFEAFRELGVPFVAVRSSATSEDGANAAWAGQLESFLNTSEEELLEHVKQCWSSLFTPRAIFYRQEKQLNEHISVAVVVQAMVQSEVSGVAFSVHPISQDRNQLMIEASYGLGEAIVSGQVTPDNYVVEKEPRRILETNIHEKKRALYRSGAGNEWSDIPADKARSQSLTRSQILTLSEVVLSIEAHYGFPCDIEWGFEAERFYIVQSRPITTLSQEAPFVKAPFYEKIFARDFSLPLIETWCNAESTDPRQWTDQTQIKKPYLVFERTQGTVNCYMDPKGIDWVKAELMNQLAKDPGFVQMTVAMYSKKTDRIRAIWNAEQTLNLPDLKQFIRELSDAWPWFEAVWWLMEVHSDHQELLKLLTEARTVTDRIGPGSDSVIRSSLQQAYPHLEKYSAYLRVEEILSERIPELAVLQARAKGYIFTDAQLLVGATLESIEHTFGIRIERISLNGITDTLTGEIAYPGRVQGKVRIIMGRDAVDEIEQGEVLVSSMTTPDFLPAMKQASAFVTDEGGITCHAAIMAREFKKPTVIGTKVATSVLRTGDLVEVDADTGKVRILERAAQSKMGLYSDHQTLFQVGGMPYLISDLWGDHYRSLRFLLVFQNNLWTSFLPRSVVEQTLADGEKLYGDREAFRVYKEGFEVYKQASKTFFEQELQTSSISKSQLEKFLEYAAGLFVFYSKTEFFYTDRAFLASTNSSVLRENLKALEDVKNEGRAYLNQIYFGATGYLNQYLEKLGQQVHLTLDVLIQYSRAELISLFDGKQVAEDEITHRKHSYIIRTVDQGVETYAGQEAFDLIEQFLNKSLSGEQTLKGICANKGYAKGSVKVLFSGYDNFDTLAQAIESMEPGSILVAETTSPELMLACKKASAIVTNQGGLMSHAAIVSREMDIPCIVGTGNATKVLRDGDVVEVNGEKGEVHIIHS